MAYDAITAHARRISHGWWGAPGEKALELLLKTGLDPNMQSAEAQRDRKTGHLLLFSNALYLSRRKSEKDKGRAIMESTIREYECL